MKNLYTLSYWQNKLTRKLKKREKITYIVKNIVNGIFWE